MPKQSDVLINVSFDIIMEYIYFDIIIDRFIFTLARSIRVIAKSRSVQNFPHILRFY